jgi:phosphatidylglycerophosphate synthase
VPANPLPHLYIIADAPGAQVQLCGISLLERLLRITQRLGFVEATIATSTAAPIRAELAKSSWAREKLQLHIVERAAGPLLVHELSAAAERLLIVPADVYCDSRLLRVLMESEHSSALYDSAPPERLRPLLVNATQVTGGYFPGAVLLHRDLLSTLTPDALLRDQLATASLATIDVQEQSTYIVSTRRHVRPLWFPAPAAEHVPLAEQLILDTAQKGTLDIPARIHGPIETWLVSRLCKTSITPNQLTLLTMLVSLGVIAQFATGWLVSGVITALVVGVLDGLDGKQARVTVQTTEIGEWEHELDYVLETTWWLALAYHFHSTEQLPHAWWLVGALIALDLLDRAGRGLVKRKIGRDLDDATGFDQLVRLVGGRRNIFTWIMAAATLLFAAPAAGFVLLCWWGIATAVVHLTREAWICAR